MQSEIKEYGSAEELIKTNFWEASVSFMGEDEPFSFAEDDYDSLKQFLCENKAGWSYTGQMAHADEVDGYECPNDHGIHDLKLKLDISSQYDYDEDHEVDIQPAWLYNELNKPTERSVEKNKEEWRQSNTDSSKGSETNQDSKLRVNQKEINESNVEMVVEPSKEDDRIRWDLSNDDHNRSEKLTKWVSKQSGDSFEVLSNSQKSENTHNTSKTDLETPMKKRDKKLVRKTKGWNLKTTRKKTESSPHKLPRRRTKLLSSGESSSTEPMDLSKRRDVVNKTILRVLRRYMATKLSTSRNTPKEERESR